ncbi:MAG: exo-alpha-sialidase [Neisseriaceae bacterium]|jgi:predicted neuraminidase
MKYQKITYVWFYLFIVIFTIFSILCLNQKNHLASELKRKFSDIDLQQINYLQVTPLFESYIIPQPSYLLSAHSSTFEVLKNGSLIAFWFAGSHEGKPDVNIWQSYFRNGKWSKATAIITRKSMMNDTRMFVKKLGNPVVYKAVNNTLHLFVVSVSLGGWSGSSINQMVSKDNGNTWGMAQKIYLSPFFNISTLVRTKAVSLEDGGFYLPVYHEFMRKYPELLYFDENGNFIYQQRINDINHLLQPSIVEVSSESAFVYYRNHSTIDSRMLMQATLDGGKSFGRVTPTDIFNQDSSMATINLGNGQLLMVRNIEGRSKLVLSISSNGVIWHDIVNLEDTKNGEFSYPSIQIHDGVVDILYTWQRKYIKHVRFNIAWLKKQKNYSGK